MIKKRTISIGFFFLMSISFIVIPLNCTAASYSMVTTSGKSVVWEDTVVNISAIQGLITDEEYPDGWLQYEVGDQLRWDITEVGDYSSETDSSILYWGFDVTAFTGTDVMNNSGASVDSGIWYEYKDPEDLAAAWTLDYYIDALVLLPKEVNAYLTAFKTALGGGYTHITVDGSTIKQNNTADTPTKTDMIIITFNEMGIQNNVSYYHNGYLAYQNVLEGYYDTPSDILFIIIILIVVSVIVAVVAGVIYSKSKSSRTTNASRGEVKDSSKQVSYRTYASGQPTRSSIPQPTYKPADNFFEELEGTPLDPKVKEPLQLDLRPGNEKDYEMFLKKRFGLELKEKLWYFNGRGPIDDLQILPDSEAYADAFWDILQKTKEINSVCFIATSSMALGIVNSEIPFALSLNLSVANIGGIIGSLMKKGMKLTEYLGSWKLQLMESVATPPPAKKKQKPKVAGVCELCGADQEEDAKFCPNCGNKFDR